MVCMIVGGLGFLGQNLCRTLYFRGCDVIIYARCSDKASKCEEELRGEGIFHKVIWGNFETENEWINYMKGVDIVFHLVSTTKPFNQNLPYDIESNVLPSLRLIEACIKYNVRIIFFSSGGTVYGVPRYLPIDEEHPIAPISTYGISKMIIERSLSYYGYTQNLDYLILRISNPYGKGQDVNGKQGMIAVSLSRAIQGKAIEIWGIGNVIRDYIYIDDLMEAVSSLLDYHGTYRIFNIGHAKGYSVSEIVSIIQRYVKPRVAVSYQKGRIQDVPVNILSHNLITEEVGWKPRVEIDEGIKRMVQLWNNRAENFS